MQQSASLNGGLPSFFPMPNSGNTSYHADHNSHSVFNYDHHQQHQQQHLLAISQYNFNPIEPSTASLYYHCAQSINQWANLPTSRSEKTHIPVNDDSSSSSSRVVENGRDFQTRKINSNRHFDKLGGEKAKTKRRAIQKTPNRQMKLPPLPRMETALHWIYFCGGGQ